MGSLVLSSPGLIYLDANPVIYSVEKVSPYHSLLGPLWEASEIGQIEVKSSELTLLEVMVKPLREGDSELIALYDRIFTSSEIELLPITARVLRTAARLRATHGLRTPDAIHAATAITTNCLQFITNDSDFRRVPELKVTVLHELI